VIIGEDKNIVIKRVEAILRERGFDLKTFQAALEQGRGKKRVMEDMAVGNKVPVTGTPALIINGDFIREEFNEKVLERYLKK
jgi:predicted DsbA family dithiol-disulfide isomerase